MDIAFGGIEAFERFTRFTERLAVAVDAPFIIAAEATSHVLEENAKKIHGDNTKLDHLAQATQDERTALGYTPDDPLKRTGELLEASVERFHEGMTAAAGSSEKIAAYHEYGFWNHRANRFVNPRPVYEITLKDSEPEVEVFAEDAVRASLGFGALRP